MSALNHKKIKKTFSRQHDQSDCGMACLLSLARYYDGDGDLEGLRELSAIISISDNGDGIIPEAIDKIFIPFYSTKKTGSGIGLSLSRQIMQLHQGTLTVKSVPDQGSTFVMKF